MNALKLIYFITGMITFQASFGRGAPIKAQNPVPVSVISYEITGDYPHDAAAFTQGLEMWGRDHFLESTGQYGKSEIRKVQVKTGKVIAFSPLEPHFFGEGAARIGGDVFQLTWQEGQVLKWTFDSKLGFKLMKKIPLAGEGWGLTTGHGSLWVSSGTSEIVELNTSDLSIKRRINVTLMGRSQDKLNELEWVEGKIFANVWMTGSIVRIRPRSGIIDGIIDISPLMPKGLSQDAVANGIAWDTGRHRLYVTGKFWPKVYELRLKGL